MSAQLLNLKMWPLAQYVNFNLVPPDFQACLRPAHTTLESRVQLSRRVRTRRGPGAWPRYARLLGLHSAVHEVRCAGGGIVSQ